MIPARALFACGAAMFAAACGEVQDTTEQAPARPEPLIVAAAYADQAYLPSLFAGFTRETGIAVTVRHRAEQENVDDLVQKRGAKQADLLFTTSVHGIWQAADEGALRPVIAEGLADGVPGWLRDADGYWTATGFSSVLIVLNGGESTVPEPADFADLGDAEYHRRLCVSSSSLAVNRVLVANLVADMGRRPAEILVRGWIANLALPPFEDEFELLEAVAGGRCGVGIASGRATTVALRSLTRADIVTVLPATAYADVEAIGVGRHAASPDAARTFIEWFLQDEQQLKHWQGSGMLPANRDALATIEAGREAEVRRNVATGGSFDVEAVLLAERASWY